MLFIHSQGRFFTSGQKRSKEDSHSRCGGGGECLNSEARCLYLGGLVGVTTMTATTMSLIATICKAPTMRQAPDSVPCVTPSQPGGRMVICRLSSVLALACADWHRGGQSLCWVVRGPLGPGLASGHRFPPASDTTETWPQGPSHAWDCQPGAQPLHLGPSQLPPGAAGGEDPNGPRVHRDVYFE